MFDRVIIGIDEQRLGRDEIVLGQRLVRPGGELTLAHVHGGYPIPAWGANAEFTASERERAQRLLEQARAQAGIDARLDSIGAPSVGRALHELAEQRGADLLVVGSTRRGLLGRVLLGDDTSAAINGAPCAVAIAPAGYAESGPGLHEIGVAYNGSTESKQALSAARRLAEQHDARLSAFEAICPPPSIAGLNPVSGRAIRHAVEQARDRIEALGGIEAHAAYGDPTEELAVYSSSIGLLVIGSRDYGPLGRLVHGSTTHELLRCARCPLLVLTRIPRAAELHGLASGAWRARA